MLIGMQAKTGLKRFGCFAALACMAALLAACGGEAATTIEPLDAPTLLPPTPTPAPTPTFLPTPAGPTALLVWWPEPLAPVGDVAAAAILSAQIEAFEQAHADIMIESRLKKPKDVGGIMETLRVASAVAPGALPDLTLLRREDLLVAVQSGLVQPLEGLVSSAILGSLYTAALELGQVNGQLYGLPYILDVNHIAYRGDFLSDEFALFETVLARGRRFVFAAGNLNAISGVFLTQYLSAGGSLSDISLGEINPNALEAVLRFYEQAVAAGLVDPAVLTFASADDYVAALRDSTLDAGVVSSTVYLNLAADDPGLAFAPVPMQAGQPTTLLNGWLWVITTANADRKMMAAAFLEWMMEAGGQADYTEAIHMLPSQRAAMRQLDINPLYVDFVTQLLGNAILLPPEIGSSPTARAMQNALAAVLSGQRSAEQAAQDVLNQLSG